jgi:hypothetical protein
MNTGREVEIFAKSVHGDICITGLGFQLILSIVNAKKYQKETGKIIFLYVFFKFLCDDDLPVWFIPSKYSN